MCTLVYMHHLHLEEYLIEYPSCNSTREFCHLVREAKKNELLICMRPKYLLVTVT